jgi:tetrahydromethanopterin S-methyltransferase subunit G
MADEKIDLVLQELQTINSRLDRFEKKTESSLAIIDKRLSLIEQRLANIEPWVSVDNKALTYKAAG